MLIPVFEAAGKDKSEKNNKYRDEYFRYEYRGVDKGYGFGIGARSHKRGDGVCRKMMVGSIGLSVGMNDTLVEYYKRNKVTAAEGGNGYAYKRMKICA